MRWMICWDDEGLASSNHQNVVGVADVIAGCRASTAAYRTRVLIWLRNAELGDVLEFPDGIVVRTSEHATEIGYDREETGS